MTEYIYALICPIDKQIKYIGKSKNPSKRYMQHITKLDKSQTPKKTWLQMLFSKGLNPEIDIIEKCEADGRGREQFHVDKHKETILNIHNPKKGAKSFKGKYPKKNVKR